MFCANCTSIGNSILTLANLCSKRILTIQNEIKPVYFHYFFCYKSGVWPCKGGEYSEKRFKIYMLQCWTSTRYELLFQSERLCKSVCEGSCPRRFVFLYRTKKKLFFIKNFQLQISLTRWYCHNIRVSSNVWENTWIL